MLPERDRASEDAFLAEWRDSDDQDALLELIDIAVGERRMMLAARLVGLIDGEVAPGSNADRARKAARFLLHSAKEVRGEWDVHEGAFEDLEAAWREVRKGRMDRIRARQRDALAGRNTRIGRFTRRPGKR